MFSREEALSDWRQQLSPKRLQQNSIGACVASYVNNNKARLARMYENRKDALAREKDLATKLLDRIETTLFSAQSCLELIPYSTMMLEDPKSAFIELSRWTKILVEAIAVHSHLETRIGAISSNMYWRVDTM